DAGFPALRFLGIERVVPIFAEQLVQRRRLETFAIARAQDGSARQAPDPAGGEQRLPAIAAVIVVADAAVDRQAGERLDAELAVSAGDFGAPGREGRQRRRERGGGRTAAEARALVLQAEDRRDAVADGKAALIFPA